MDHHTMSPLLSPGRCLLLALLAAGVAAAELAPPAAWVGKAAGEEAIAGIWSLCQVWPDKPDDPANYLPLHWNGKGWSAPEHSNGGRPSAEAAAGAIVLEARGNWGGVTDDPGARLPALLLAPEAAGVYRVQAEVEMKRGTGSGPGWLRIIVLPPNGTPAKADPKTKAEARIGKGRIVDRLRFRLPSATVAMDCSLFLAAGERLALVPALNDNTLSSVRIAGLRVGCTPASAAPADFVDGVLPKPAIPRADDEQPPATVIEGEQHVFPADAGVIDASKPPYNCVGDGRTDCTAGLQQALSQGGVIWLPNGVYLISDQLRYTKGARVPSRTTLHGQSVKGTILKLRDRTPDFGDPKNPLSMLWTSTFPPQAFRIHVRDLTFHVGSGNPGAIGCQFYANNQGSIEDVRFMSGDGAGVYGLDLGYADDQGPMLARGIEVIGFDIGIRTARQTTITTLCDVRLENQRVMGWSNDLHAITVQGLHSRNQVPTLVNSDPGGYVAIIDGAFEGTAGAAKLPAIDNAGGMYLRDVSSSGYRCTVSSGGKDAGPKLDEWTSHPAITLWDDVPKRMLRLPIVPQPRVPWGDPATWQSMGAFPPKVVDTGVVYKGKAVTYDDWTSSLQQALAAGKPTVYLPRGNYSIDGEVRVPGQVRRLIGMESSFERSRGRCTLVIEDGPDPLVIERFDWNYSKVVISHASRRPLILRNIVGSHYLPQPGAGDVWMDDICQGGLSFVKGQRVWARQLNPEYGDKPHITNLGADLWILGLKTEGYSTIVATGAGARTEIIGGCLYANQQREAEPAFINAPGSAFSGTWAEWILRSCPFEEMVVESRTGEPFRILHHRDLPKRGDAKDKQLGGYGTASMVPLYAGFTAARAGEAAP